MKLYYFLLLTFFFVYILHYDTQKWCGTPGILSTFKNWAESSYHFISKHHISSKMAKYDFIFSCKWRTCAFLFWALYIQPLPRCFGKKTLCWHQVDWLLVNSSNFGAWNSAFHEYLAFCGIRILHSLDFLSFLQQPPYVVSPNREQE